MYLRVQGSNSSGTTEAHVQPRLMRSRIITPAFGLLCEIIKANMCVIAKLENFLILTFFLICLFKPTWMYLPTAHNIA